MNHLRYIFEDPRDRSHWTFEVPEDLTNCVKRFRELQATTPAIFHIMHVMKIDPVCARIIYDTILDSEPIEVLEELELDEDGQPPRRSVWDRGPTQGDSELGLTLPGDDQ